MNRAHFVSDLDTDRFLAWINVLVPAAFAYQGMDVVAMWIPFHLDLTVTDRWLKALPQKLKTLAAILRKRFDVSFGEFSSSTWVSCTCDCYLRSDVYPDSGYSNDRHASCIQWSFLASKWVSRGTIPASCHSFVRVGTGTAAQSPFVIAIERAGVRGIYYQMTWQTQFLILLFQSFLTSSMLASSLVLSHQGMQSYLVHRDSCMALPSEARLLKFSHGARRTVSHFLLFSSLYVEPFRSSDFLRVDEQGYFWCPRLYDRFSWEWDSLQVSRSERLKRKLTCWNLLLSSWLVGLTTTSSFFSWLVINLTFTRFRKWGQLDEFDSVLTILRFWDVVPRDRSEIEQLS